MIKPGKSVTLVCVDTVSVLRSVPAFARALSCMRVERALFFHDRRERGFSLPGVEFIPLAGIKDKEGENAFHVRDLWRYVTTERVWTVEWDSWVVRPEAWEEGFLECDVIGAPWAFGGAHNVGNSGFSLRSRRFVELTAELQREYKGRFYPRDYKECVEFRTVFERRGIVYAPQDVAARFSWERNELWPEYRGAFGCHDIKDWSGYLGGHWAAPGACQGAKRAVPARSFVFRRRDR